MNEQEKTGRYTFAPKLKDRIFRDMRLPVDPYAERGRALSCTATLEGVLRDILLANFLPIFQEHENELFEGFGPFANFKVRIETAYVRGLISENERRNLHLIRKIRNDFAHEPGEEIRFEQQNIKNRCRELELPQIFIEKIEADWNNPRNRFMGAYLFTLVLLILQKVVIKHQPKAKTYSAEFLEQVLEPDILEGFRLFLSRW